MIITRLPITSLGIDTMTPRILVACDGSDVGGNGFDAALQLANDKRASIYVIGIADDAAKGTAWRERLNDDLVAFARLGRRFGIDVDGSILEDASRSRVAALMKAQCIDHVLVAKPVAGGAPAKLADMLVGAARTARIEVIMA